MRTSRSATPPLSERALGHGSPSVTLVRRPGPPLRTSHIHPSHLPRGRAGPRSLVHRNRSHRYGLPGTWQTRASAPHVAPHGDVWTPPRCPTPSPGLGDLPCCLAPWVAGRCGSVRPLAGPPRGAVLSPPGGRHVRQACAVLLSVRKADSAPVRRPALSSCQSRCVHVSSGMGRVAPLHAGSFSAARERQAPRAPRPRPPRLPAPGAPTPGWWPSVPGRAGARRPARRGPASRLPGSHQVSSVLPGSGTAAVLVVLHRRCKAVHSRLGVENPGFECAEGRE